jgi:hypothetical protein
MARRARCTAGGDAAPDTEHDFTAFEHRRLLAAWMAAAGSRGKPRLCRRLPKPAGAMDGPAGAIK